MSRADSKRLIGIAAHGSLPQDKIKARINAIKRKRTDLADRLETVNEDLSPAAAFIDTCLDLMTNPYAVYAKPATTPAASSTRPYSTGSTSTKTMSPATNSNRNWRT